MVRATALTEIIESLYCFCNLKVIIHVQAGASAMLYDNVAHGPRARGHHQTECNGNESPVLIYEIKLILAGLKF